MIVGRYVRTITVNKMFANIPIPAIIIKIYEYIRRKYILIKFNDCHNIAQTL